MIIKIVGAGCPSCKQLETDVRQWLKRHHVEAQVERIDDLIEIMQLGVMALPGLLIDEQLVMTGYHRARLEKVLREACEGAT